MAHWPKHQNEITNRLEENIENILHLGLDEQQSYKETQKLTN